MYLGSSWLRGNLCDIDVVTAKGKMSTCKKEDVTKEYQEIQEVKDKDEKKKCKKTMKSSEEEHENESRKSSTVLLESAEPMINANQVLAKQSIEPEKIVMLAEEEAVRKVEEISFNAESVEEQKMEETREAGKNDLSAVKEMSSAEPRSKMDARDSLEKINFKMLAKLKEAFHLFDINQDGFIDKADLKFTFTSLGKPDVSDDQLEHMLSEMSNPVDFDAFVEQFGYKATELDSEDTLTEALSKWDYEGNGTISEERIRHDLQTWGDKFTNREVDRALEEAPLYTKKGVTTIDYITFSNNICGLRNVYKDRQNKKGRRETE